jgi:signal transduction histidine kinase
MCELYNIYGQSYNDFGVDKQTFTFQVKSNMKSLVSYPNAVTLRRPSYHSNSGMRFTDTDSRSWIGAKLVDDRGSFITALVHELRNPLTNIKLSVELLESASTDDKGKTFLDIIRRSSMRISDLINDLLKNKQEEAEVERYSIHQLLDETLELARDRISLKKIVVIKKYEEDCELILNGPEMKIALTNIIVNAIEAMTTGGGQLTLITRSIESKYILVIKDNGSGISKENLKNIFKPHYTNKPGGLGIGLAATANILRANNVRVNVESKETKGTCFILLFDRNE